MILSILAICLNIPEIVCQSPNNNNLIISDFQSLLSQTQQNVRAYLSTILVNSIIKNVDAIFASASLNLTNVVNNSYSCSRLTTLITTTSTTKSSNCFILLVSFKLKHFYFLLNNYISHYINNHHKNYKLDFLLSSY